MKNIYMFILLLITLQAQAQVCGKSIAKDGTVTKLVTVQFGKDTVVMNVPYKVKDKQGIAISISSTNNKRYFSFVLRTVEPKLLHDSIYINRARVILTMNNADTVQITPLTRNHFDSYTFPTPGAKTLFIHDYLNNKQLAVLRNNQLVSVRFYLAGNDFVELPVTRHEQHEFQMAMAYLLN